MGASVHPSYAVRLQFPCFCTRPQQVGLLQQSPDRLATHSHPASPVSPNAAARLIFNPRRCDHITEALISLHWLRVPERIIFKVATATLMYRVCMVPHHLTWRHSHVSPTCRSDASSGPPPLNSLTFRPVVGQLSEVVPFLLLEQRCGIACQAMLRRPRRCRCSRTG